MKLLGDQDLLLIEAHLDSVVARLLDAPGLAPMREMIRRYVMAGGKRVRPQLAVWTFVNSGRWAVCSGQVLGLTDGNVLPTAHGPLPTSLLDLACAWELFHAFLLVHDDIIDASDTRRDRPALHVTLASLDSNSPVFGTNLAIVAGDLLFSAAMRLWHDLEVEPRTYRDLLKLFSRTATTTGFGQAIDIVASHQAFDAVEESTLLREYTWKTAAYTFEGPMLSGAILAGLGAEAQHAISRFALALGQAYQLQNDLLDLRHEAHEGCDLVQGKRTLSLIRHRSALCERGRRELDGKLHAIAAGNGHAVDLANELRRELLSGGVAERSRTLIDELLFDARSACADENLPSRLARGMDELLAALSKQYFVE
ncbi:MAG: polyprenyl synthetase family protein [Tepidisphaeraceae bacterium]